MPNLFGEDTLEELQWKIGQARQAAMTPDQRTQQLEAARRTDPAYGESEGSARLSRVMNPERRPELFDFPNYPRDLPQPQPPSGLPPEEFQSADDVYRAIGRAMIAGREMGPIVVPKGIGR